MNLVIKEGESQAAFVRRTLREHGEISQFDCDWNLTDQTGARRGITRLAAIISRLRDQCEGTAFAIVTVPTPGQTRLATYRLVRRERAA